MGDPSRAHLAHDTHGHANIDARPRPVPTMWAWLEGATGAVLASPTADHPRTLS